MERSKKIQRIEVGLPDTELTGTSGTKSDSTDNDLSENHEDYGSGGLSLSDLDGDDGISSNELDSCNEEAEDSTTNLEENLIPMSLSAPV